MVRPITVAANPPPAIHLQCRAYVAIERLWTSSLRSAVNRAPPSEPRCDGQGSYSRERWHDRNLRAGSRCKIDKPSPAAGLYLRQPDPYATMHVAGGDRRSRLLSSVIPGCCGPIVTGFLHPFYCLPYKSVRVSQVLSRHCQDGDHLNVSLLVPLFVGSAQPDETKFGDPSAPTGIKEILDVQEWGGFGSLDGQCLTIVWPRPSQSWRVRRHVHLPIQPTAVLLCAIRTRN
jgi:hypothetical protein